MSHYTDNKEAKSVYKKLFVISAILLISVISFGIPEIRDEMNTAFPTGLFNIFNKGLTDEQKAIKKSATRWKLDPKMMYAVCMIETGCRKGSKARGSTAAGMYQYIDSTWILSTKKYVKVMMRAGTFDKNLENLNNLTRACVSQRNGKPISGCGPLLREKHNPYTAAEVFALDRMKRLGLMRRHANASGLPEGAIHYMDHFHRGLSASTAQLNVYNRLFSRLTSNAIADSHGFGGKTVGQVIDFFVKKYKKFAAKTPDALLKKQEDVPALVSDYTSYDSAGEYDTYTVALNNQQFSFDEPSYDVERELDGGDYIYYLSPVQPVQLHNNGQSSANTLVANVVLPVSYVKGMQVRRAKSFMPTSPGVIIRIVQ